MSKFFDVCSCTCPSASRFQVHCKVKNYDGFHLADKYNVKVPKREIHFLLDKRCARKMVIADIYYFILFYLYIYPLDSQESDGGANT